MRKSVQTTLEEVFSPKMMEEVKNFELGKSPRFLSKKWELFNLTRMIRGEANISILHKDLSVVQKEFFVNGSEKDKIDFTNLAFGLLDVDDIL